MVSVRFACVGVRERTLGGMMIVFLALVAVASFAARASAAGTVHSDFCASSSKIQVSGDQPESRAWDGHRTGFVASLGYGSLSIDDNDDATTETWNMIDVAIGLSVLSGSLQFLLEGMISPSRTRHVPNNGWVPEHDVTTHYRALLLRARGRLIKRFYGALGIGFIDRASTSSYGIIESSSNVTGDWTLGGDIKVLNAENVNLFAGVQIHNFFASGESAGRGFGLVTFHATVLFH